MTSIWVTSALFFCAAIYLYTGTQQATEFLTGYIIELSLSMDNVFVFIMIFTYFKVPMQYQHRVLFWGILGAVIMRFIMIIGGVYLIHYFEWLFLFLGAFLIYTGYHIAASNHDAQDVKDDKKNIITFLRRFFRITNDFHGDKFFIKHKKKLVATPLFVVLLIVEKTDLIFALDSIPAVLAITRDPFIVFTSNVFAILGLRSMYFLLATIIHKFRFLKYGISIILVFVGIKMILSVIGFKIPTMVSLSLITTTLFASILISVIIPPAKNRS
ncbi:UNVERIFIED_CONTAM: hypothetical protein GTU68_045556 [Idotea baltica]|nr:hypothetical protein [Idotea baltica]